MKTHRFVPPRPSSSANPGGSTAFLISIAVGLGFAASAADLFVELRPSGWSTWSQHSWAPAWGDVDHDGLLDAFVPRSLTGEGTGAAANLLYRNEGNRVFRSMSVPEVGSVVSDQEPSIQGCWGDVNNDGRPDLLVVNLLASGSSPPVASRLYLGQENGRFVSIDAGDLTLPQYTYGFASWCDFDRDGWLDVFLSAAWADSGHRTNLLFRGTGDGRFSLVTEGTVATDTLAAGFTNESIWSDLDGDGDADLLVANWSLPNRGYVYRNDGAAGFTRLTENILEVPRYASARYAVGDLDNDGDTDVVASGLLVRVFLNDGNGEFTLGQVLPAFAPAACGDYDNDGYLDLALFREDSSSEPIDLYHNNGDGTFTQVEDALTRTRAAWIGGPWIDVDNDGFLDLMAGQKSGGNFLYRNQGNGNHWLKFRLQGVISNRSAIGAKVRVRSTLGGNVVWQLREILSTGMAEDGLRPHFGLRDATVADEVRIEWPSGTVQELREVQADQIMVVTEPSTIQLRCVRQTQGLALELQAAPNTTYEIQTSLDLRTWVLFRAVLTDSSGVAVSEVTPGADPFRFYRALPR